MAESVARNMSRDFWNEAKKLRSSHKSVAKCVDGCNDASGIMNVFVNKYNNLYNSVPYCENEMKHISNDVDVLIKSENSDIPCININDVAKAISHLKKGKTGLSNMISSDNLINGSNLLNIFLSFLFNSMLKHGTVIDAMTTGVMSPIPKGKRCDDSNSNNYRAITIGSLIGKVYDWVMLLKNKDVLASDDLQFGFKPNLSTTLCTSMLLETVSSFNDNGSDVYGLFLDASKAFDRINYSHLFKKLISKTLHGLYIRSLLNMYTNSKLIVKWNNVLSKPFKCSNGVKQGGVLSPILFAIYIDDLLKELRCNGMGCYVNSMFCGSFAYADDIVLLAPTVTSLTSMVKICEQYSTKYDILFNSSKSKLITFSKKKAPFQPTITINDDIVPWVDTVNHLGHELYCNIFKRDQRRVISDFNMRVNTFNFDFGSLHIDIKNRLFRQYCCSFYGTQLYDLSSEPIDNICRAWRVGFRKIWRLPKTTHCNLLHSLGNFMEPHLWFVKRFLTFYISAINSKNNIVVIYQIYHVVQTPQWGQIINMFAASSVLTGVCLIPLVTLGICSNGELAAALMTV